MIGERKIQFIFHYRGQWRRENANTLVVVALTHKLFSFNNGYRYTATALARQALQREGTGDSRGTTPDDHHTTLIF
jgi:hypothetical protein